MGVEDSDGWRRGVCNRMRRVQQLRLRRGEMIGTIAAVVLVVGILGLSTWELSANGRSLRLLVVGAILGVVVVSVAAWDWVAGVARPVQLAGGLAVVILLAWTFVVRRESVRR
jgi:hypothetical protein